MTATVHSLPTAREVGYWAECHHCGWAEPRSGVVSRGRAEQLVAEHNGEVHGEKAA